MTQNYKIGWIGTGRLGRITAHHPGWRLLRVRRAVLSTAPRPRSSLAALDSSPARRPRPKRSNPIGTFDAFGTGAWSRNNLVALTDKVGKVKTVNFTGAEDHPLDVQQRRCRLPAVHSRNHDAAERLHRGEAPGSNMVIEWTSGTLESARRIASDHGQS